MLAGHGAVACALVWPIGTVRDGCPGTQHCAGFDGDPHNRYEWVALLSADPLAGSGADGLTDRGVVPGDAESMERTNA